MAHDGQDMTSTTSVILDDLLAKTADAIAPVDAILEAAKDRLRGVLSENGRVSATLVEQNQTAAHGLAWLATYVQALHQMQKWATTLDENGQFGEVEKLILQIGVGEYLGQIQGGIPMNQGEILRPHDMGLTTDDIAGLSAPATMTLIRTGNTQSARIRLVALMQERNAEITVGATGLDEELEMIRAQFRRYALEKVEPFAHDWHLKDELIPIEVINELAEMGVFGLTIPEEHGGLGLSKASMCVVSEELSRGYIGVGSLGTRSEIAAELIIAGGTDAQKAEWLPRIASGSALKKMDKQMPVFIFSGSEDPVGERTEGVKRLLAAYHRHNFTRVTHKFYVGGRHEMLNEINRDEVFTDIIAWANSVT